MTRERFLDALDAIDIDIVEDFVLTDNALKKRSEHKNPKYLKWATLVACFLLVVCVVPFIKNIFTPSHGSSPVTVRYDSFEELAAVLPYNNFYNALDSGNANTVSIGMSYESDKDGNAITTQPLQLKIRQTYEYESYTDTVDFYIIFGKTDVNESYIAGYEEQGLTKEINGVTVHYSMIEDGAKHAQGKFIYEGNLYVVDVLSGGSEYVLDVYLEKVLYNSLFGPLPSDDSFIALGLEHYCAWAATMKHHDDILLQEDFIAEDIPKEIAVKLSGDEAVLRYKERSIVFSSGQIIDIYSNEEETITVAPIRNSDAYMALVDTEAENDPSVKTRDECFAIAKNYLLNYVTDIDNYILTEEKINTGIKTRYQFTFQRKIDDIFAEDKLLINVLGNGNIEHLSGTKIGSLEGVSTKELPDINVARPYALKKLKSICDGMDEYTYTFKELDIRAEAFKGGIVALTYKFEVAFTPKAEGKQGFSDVIYIVVYKNNQ